MAGAEKSNELIIEITSDFVCPWCYIGEVRLEKALGQIGSDVKVRRAWRPYELNPDMPGGGMDRKEYLTKKFGSAERLQEIDERLKTLGANDGIDIHPDLIRISPNTRMAHRVMWLADKEDKADALARLIFKAYFTEGRNIGDADLLAALAGKVGLDAKATRLFLTGTEGVEEVKQMELEAKDRGIEAVPFTVIGGTEEMHGALEVHDIVDSLNTALKLKKAA